MPIALTFYDEAGVKKMQEDTRERRRALEESSIPKEYASWKVRFIHKSSGLAMRLRNNSVENDPNLDVSCVFAVAGTFAFAMYTFGRAYILIEDAIAFRALPTSAYVTVNWWSLLLHIG